MKELFGKTLDQNYRIERLLGQGSVGAVYQARDLALDQDVAIKVVDPQYAGRADFRTRFLQAVWTVAALDHPGIVRLHACGQDMLYLVMDLIPGQSLAAWLECLATEGRLITLIESLAIARQVALALHHAHGQGIVHGGVKPANILFRPADPALSTPGDLPFGPVLTDFELAGLVEIEERGGQDATALAYLSPEQVQGLQPEARSDVYALGVVLWEMVAGSVPFEAPSLAEAVRYHTQEPPPSLPALDPALPAEVQAIVLRALARRPEERFATAQEMAGAIRAVLPGVAAAVARAGTRMGNRSYVSLMALLEAAPPSPALAAPEAVAPAVTAPAVTAPTAAAPDGRPEAALVVFSPDGSSSRIPARGPCALTVGRSRKNDIHLEDERASRHHARLEFDGQNWTVTDLDSSNGTFLDQLRLPSGQSHPWAPEASLRIGQHRFQIETPQAPPEQPPQRPQEPAVFEPEALTVEAGQQATARLHIHNPGTQADRFHAAVDGLSPRWVTLPREPLPLGPGQAGTVLISFHPPREPRSAAGPHSFTVRAVSEADPRQAIQVGGTLNVRPFHDLAAEMPPQPIEGGQARLELENRGNVPLNLSVAARDPSDAVQVRADPARLALRAGERQAVSLQATARQARPLLGSTRYHPFQVTVTSPEGPGLKQEGTVAIRPLIPAWMPLIALPLVVAAVVLAVLLGPWSKPPLTPTPTPMPTLPPLLTPTAMPLNRPPGFATVPSTAAAEGTEYVYQILATDPDAGDRLTITAPVLPPWLSLADQHNGTAILRGTPISAHVGTHQVGLLVQDTAGATASQPFAIIVASKDRPLSRITIRSAANNAGEEVAAREMTADGSLALYAAGYDADGRYIGDVAVTWSTDHSQNSILPGPSASATFAPTKAPASVTITANDGSHRDTAGPIAVRPGALVKIVIRDAPGGAGNAVSGRTVKPGASLALYAAGYDAKDNYIGDVSATWSKTGSLEAVPAGPSISVLFRPNTAGTSGTIAATDGQGHKGETGTLTVVSGDLSRIAIRSAANNAGEEVAAREMTADGSLALYAAGYDADGRYIGDVAVTWSTDHSQNSILPGPSASATFAPTKAPASVTITAKDDLGHSDTTGIITIKVGVLAKIVIRDAPGGAGNAVSDRSIVPGGGLTLYAAGYDADNNYIVDQAVTWSGGGVAAGRLAPTQGISTTLTVPGEAAGTGTITAVHSSIAGIAPVNISVTDVNNPPTDIGLSNQTIAENMAIGTTVGTLSTVDPDDPDGNDGYTYSLISGSGGADNGSFSIDGHALKTAGSFDYETKSSYSIRVQTMDQGNLVYSKQFTITVNDINEAPVISQGDSVSVTMDEDSSPTPFSLTLNADDDDNDSLTWSVSTAAGHGTASAVGAGTLGTLGNISYTPASNYNDTDHFVVQVSDGSLMDTITVNVTINPVNDAPVNTVPVTQSVTLSGTLTFSISNGNPISVTDPDAGDGAVKVTLIADNGTLTLAITDDLTIEGNGTGTVTFTGKLDAVNKALDGLSFAPASAGTATITIVANDQGYTGSGVAEVDTDLVNITVQEP